ncbi:MAG: class I SAM-dependent methyltransferase [Sneathiellales bacterium]|nr:class I SAM-dependent methyltransferase [Sneathiellales bacterium]
MLKKIKYVLKNIPVFGPLGNHTARFVKKTSRKLRGKTSRGWEKYVFKRHELTKNSGQSGNFSVQQVTNLLNYCKSSTAGQGAGPADFPASVSITVDGHFLKGSRDPEERLEHFPSNWEGKTVLDIGCNHGGMLFSIADKIGHGIGIDFDIATVNAANKIRSANGSQNLDFYAFDLENEDLNLIRDFIVDEKVDITFLLAVCAWIQNPNEVIEFVSKISKTLLFETNGGEDEQQSQLASLHKCYENVETLYQVKNNKNGEEYIQRRLLFCT